MNKWVSGEEIKLFLIISLALAVLVGGITALTVVLSKPPEDKSILPKESPFKSNTNSLKPGPLLLSDFILPRPGGAWLNRPWYFSRKPLEKWSVEDIKKYWVDSKTFELSKIPLKNDEFIDKLLEIAE
ncbi:MAG: hypothetical protein A2Z96_02610 [Spirochaetes bacterium GWB1_48_6]|nr:MAG: hypothetical protein A2Z96_02610 [Spirochaetes bacterium GWB1_48_6]